MRLNQRKLDQARVTTQQKKKTEPLFTARATNTHELEPEKSEISILEG